MYINWCTWIIAVLVIAGALLPPGMLDPGTNRIRFVSDGFQDHRGIPLSCFGFLLILVLLFWSFSYLGCMHSVDSFSTHYTVATWGVGSIGGFATLTLFSSGSVHLIGTAIFIVCYIIMQYTIDNLMARMTHQPFWGRVQEMMIFSVCLVGTLVFGSLLTYSYVLGGNLMLMSGSAIAEYAILVGFILLNMWGCNIISYVAREYEDQGQKNKYGIHVWTRIVEGILVDEPQSNKAQYHGSWMQDMVQCYSIPSAPYASSASPSTIYFFRCRRCGSGHSQCACAPKRKTHTF